ncbi:ZBBX protein, partial [Polyodon spathula]|nr:ZBBX protein [Polyodon spathula]
RNVREMRLETAQLQLESKDVERRLQHLRLSMSREKDERAVFPCGTTVGFHWRSGQAGALATHPPGAPQNKENNLQKLSAGKVKIKILKDQSEDMSVVLLLYRSPVGMIRSGKPKLQGKICGQCASKKAGLVMSAGISAVQTDLPHARKSVDIEFSEHSLSYMERLQLKKHRRTLVQQCRSISSPQILLMESNMQMDEEGLSLTAEEMDEHRYYTALFTVEEFHQHNQRTGSSLSVLELDEVWEKKLTQLRENPYLTQLNLSFEKRSEMSAVQESKNLGMSSLMSTLSEDEKTLSSSSRTSSSANQQRLLSAGKTSSTNVHLSCSLSVSAKLERIAQNIPQRPKQKQRQKNEKQTTSELLKFHNTPQRTSLLLNVSLEDAASTADEGPGSNQLANGSTTESTDVGLSKAALHKLAQRHPVEVDHYTALNGIFTLGLDPAHISPDPFLQRTSYQNEENKQDLRTEDRKYFSHYKTNLENRTQKRGRAPHSVPVFEFFPPPNFYYAASPLCPTNFFTLALFISTSEHTVKHEQVQVQRPVSAHAWPLSRATVEIMEIESINSTENDDPNLENEADNCALTCLEEEFKMLRNQEGNLF